MTNKVPSRGTVWGDPKKPSTWRRVISHWHEPGVACGVGYEVFGTNIMTHIVITDWQAWAADKVRIDSVEFDPATGLSTSDEERTL